MVGMPVKKEPRSVCAFGIVFVARLYEDFGGDGGFCSLLLVRENTSAFCGKQIEKKNTSKGREYREALICSVRYNSSSPSNLLTVQ